MGSCPPQTHTPGPGRLVVAQGCTQQPFPWLFPWELKPLGAASALGGGDEATITPLFLAKLTSLCSHPGCL